MTTSKAQNALCHLAPTAPAAAAAAAAAAVSEYGAALR